MELFRERLRKAMDEKHIRQVDLVTEVSRYCDRHGLEELKISAALLNMYLKGKNEPKTPRIKILAEILDVSEAWLCGFDVPKEREAPAHVSIEKEYNKLNDRNRARLEAYLRALLDSQEDE